MNNRPGLKKALIWLGRIILFPIIVFEVIIVFMMIREVFLYVFYPVNLPLSVNVTDFYDMELEYVRLADPCDGKSDITQHKYFDMTVNISNPDAYEDLYVTTYSSRGSDQRFLVDLGVIDGDLVITKYVDGKDPVSTKFSLRNQQGKRIQATATRIDADLPSDLLLSQWLCSKEISISKYGRTYDFGFGVSGIFNNYSAAKVSLNIKDDDELIVTLINPIFKDNPDEIVEKVEIRFVADGESSSTILGVEGNHLAGGFPGISTYYDKVQDKVLIPSGNSIESILIQGMKITSPQGNVQLGSYKKFDLYESLVEDTGETLEIKQIPIRLYNEESGGLSLSTKLQNDQIQFSGNAPIVEYRKQRFGASRWDQMPGYVQTGVFGLILGAVPVWWGFFRKRTGKKKSENPASDFQPAEGSFICVLDSGYMIAGTLIKEPGFWSPHYVIRDAHRKRISEKQWEVEVIPLINIKASRVEQYYFKGK